MFQQSADSLLLINILVICHFFLDQLVNDLHAEEFHRRLVVGHEVISRLICHAVVGYPLHHILQPRIRQCPHMIGQYFNHIAAFRSKQFPVGGACHIYGVDIA